MDYFIQCGDSWSQCLGMDDFMLIYILPCTQRKFECRHRATILVRQNHFDVNLYSITGQSEVGMLRSASNKRNVTIFRWNNNGTVVNGSGV